jgi:hypothetical protein
MLEQAQISTPDTSISHLAHFAERDFLRVVCHRAGTFSLCPFLYFRCGTENGGPAFLGNTGLSKAWGTKTSVKEPLSRPASGSGVAPHGKINI